MLHGANRHAVVVTDHGAQREILDVVDVGGDLGDDAATLGDHEAVAHVGLRGMQDHCDLRAAMDTHPVQDNLSSDRSLL